LPYVIWYLLTHTCAVSLVLFLAGQNFFSSPKVPDRTGGPSHSPIQWVARTFSSV